MLLNSFARRLTILPFIVAHNSSLCQVGSCQKAALVVILEVMDSHHIISYVIFIGFFLFTSSLLHHTSRKIALLPYTSALLVAGLISQLTLHYLGLDVHLNLSPGMIYYLILPLLLFESAMKINFHQFRLQFKTITFLATFGLLASVTLVGIGVSWLLGLPLLVGLLFGAIISSTDPIAVIALFSTLGAPKRLGLLAEGESMFNDATAVITFKTLLTIIVSQQLISVSLVTWSAVSIVITLVGSLIFGGLAGFAVSLLIERIDNDKLVETTMTVALALTTFIVAEHFLALSGVIATVAAGIALGNLGKTKISSGVVVFMEEFWEYLGFLSVSLVFFFATFSLDLKVFAVGLAPSLIVIGLMLVARSASVYLSFAVSNYSPWFRDEPNVPLAWQHVINWGGMRGVIPLVLVYSLPDEFIYKQLFLSFVLMAFMFTLFVNAISIRSLLTKLGIHLPKHEERIKAEEQTILNLEKAIETLEQVPSQEIDRNLITKLKGQLKSEERDHQDKLFELTDSQQLENSLKLQVIDIEFDTAKSMFERNLINESVYFDLIGELQLQQDAVEYPEIKMRGVDKEGRINSERKFQFTLRRLKHMIQDHPILGRILSATKEDLIFQRLLMLKARVAASKAAVEHLKLLQFTAHTNKEDIRIINQVIRAQQQLIRHNREHLDRLTRRFPRITKKYQKQLLLSLLKPFGVGV